eukprot:1162116-Pelagomonas_calceolata.AAC.10
MSDQASQMLIGSAEINLAGTMVDSNHGQHTSFAEPHSGRDSVLHYTFLLVKSQYFSINMLPLPGAILSARERLGSRTKQVSEAKRMLYSHLQASRCVRGKQHVFGQTKCQSREAM